MTFMRALVAIAAAALLAGCLPVTSKTPVGTTAGLKADPALYGTWKGHAPDDKKSATVFFHFWNGKNGGQSGAMVQAVGAKDDGITLFDITTTTPGQNHFINAVLQAGRDTEAKKAPASPTFPVLYVVKGRTLTLYLVDEEKARAAIKAGTLKGTVESGTSGDVTITENANDLDALMAKPEAKSLFRLLVELKKVE